MPCMLKALRCCAAQDTPRAMFLQQASHSMATRTLRQEADSLRGS